MDTIVFRCLILTQVILTVSGAVRLSGGINDREGRLEVFHDGAWGTVCGVTWTQEDSRVVCRQLGFMGEGRSIFLPSPYGPGSGEIWLENVNCTGNETILDNCPHSTWGTLTTSCNHYDDVGIVCLGDRVGQLPMTRAQPRPPSPTACVNESVRLSGGMTSREGRVEVKHRGRWGTVCDDAWDARAAAVVCSMLGYVPGTASRALSSPVPFRRGRTERIWLDDVICGLGGESCLSQCGSLGWGNHDCTHYEDAGVICLGELVLDPPTPSSTRAPITSPVTTPTTITTHAMEPSSTSTSLPTTSGKPTPITQTTTSFPSSSTIIPTTTLIASSSPTRPSTVKPQTKPSTKTSAAVTHTKTDSMKSSYTNTIVPTTLPTTTTSIAPKSTLKRTTTTPISTSVFTSSEATTPIILTSLKMISSTSKVISTSTSTTMNPTPSQASTIWSITPIKPTETIPTTDKSTTPSLIASTKLLSTNSQEITISSTSREVISRSKSSLILDTISTTNIPTLSSSSSTKSRISALDIVKSTTSSQPVPTTKFTSTVKYTPRRISTESTSTASNTPSSTEGHTPSSETRIVSDTKTEMVGTGGMTNTPQTQSTSALERMTSPAAMTSTHTVSAVSVSSTSISNAPSSLSTTTYKAIKTPETPRSITSDSNTRKALPTVNTRTSVSSVTSFFNSFPPYNLSTSTARPTLKTNDYFDLSSTTSIESGTAENSNKYNTSSDNLDGPPSAESITARVLFAGVVIGVLLFGLAILARR